MRDEMKSLKSERTTKCKTKMLYCPNWDPSCVKYQDTMLTWVVAVKLTRRSEQSWWNRLILHRSPANSPEKSEPSTCVGSADCTPVSYHIISYIILYTLNDFRQARVIPNTATDWWLESEGCFWCLYIWLPYYHYVSQFLGIQCWCHCHHT